MEQIKVSIDKTDLKRLEDISKRTGHSISSIIREATKQYLKQAKP